MKKLSIPACVTLALALLIAVGSQTFLGSCVHDDGSFGACHWAGRMLMGVGALLAVQSLLALIARDHGRRAGLFLAMAPTALLGILTPGTIISLCGMATMRCRALMQPAMILLCVLALMAALTGWWIERRRAR